MKLYLKKVSTCNCKANKKLLFIFENKKYITETYVLLALRIYNIIDIHIIRCIREKIVQKKK